MSKRHKNIFWLFVLAFVVAESILIGFTAFNFNSKRNHILVDHTNQLKTNYNAVFNSFNLVSDVIFDQIINTPQITKLYSRTYKSNIREQAIIRDSLYLLLNPTYLKLQSNFVKQMHFHLPDNRSFLRFHSPLKFGDDLTDVRETVRIANAEKRFVQAFEEGRVYNGFRFVFPLSYKGEHIGTVETSASFGAISQIMLEQAHNVYALVLKKSVIDEKVFADDRGNYIPSAISDNWVEEKRFLHYNTNYKDIPVEILEDLDKSIKENNQEELNAGLSFSVFYKVDKKRYVVSFVPVLNLKQEHVAYIISYSPDRFSDSFFFGFYGFIGAGTFLLLIVTFLFYILYKKDITIEEQQGALFDSESRYLQIYNTVDIGIISNSLDGEILMANPKIIDILGYQNLKDLKKHNIKEFYVDSNIREELIQNLITGDSKLIIHEILWKKKDGSHIVIKLGGKSHLGPDGQPFLESVVQDITEMRSLEELLKTSESDLRQSNAAKDRFFSILGHDLRGPFASLLGLTEIIALHPETLDEERKNHFIQLIFSSIQNLSNLIENLLEWSRSQQGTLNYEPKEIGLESIVTETLELLNEPAFAKQIVISASIDKSIKLFADENMIKTIFRNLIGNAIKFTHYEGLIKVEAGRETTLDGGKRIEIIVEDNGVGMSQDELDKLFQIDSGFTNRGTNDENGTGLGLVLVKEFVEKHGGTVVIESEKGLGTKAIFTLPITS